MVFKIVLRNANVTLNYCTTKPRLPQLILILFEQSFNPKLINFAVCVVVNARMRLINLTLNYCHYKDANAIKLFILCYNKNKLFFLTITNFRKLY